MAANRDLFLNLEREAADRPKTQKLNGMWRKLTGRTGAALDVPQQTALINAITNFNNTRALLNSSIAPGRPDVTSQVEYDTYRTNQQAHIDALEAHLTAITTLRTAREVFVDDTHGVDDHLAAQATTRDTERAQHADQLANVTRERDQYVAEATRRAAGPSGSSAPPGAPGSGLDPYNPGTSQASPPPRASGSTSGAKSSTKTAPAKPKGLPIIEVREELYKPDDDLSMTQIDETVAQGIDKMKTDAREHLGLAWVPGPSVGEGGFTDAGMGNMLWLKQNSKGRIVDRFVLKDSRIVEDVYPYWELKPSGPDALPNEIHAMQRLSSLSGRDHIVRLRTWRMIDVVKEKGPSDRRMHLYLEFCPYGSLADIVRFHDQSKAGRRSRIPEPFLWSVFESLTLAGKLMESGDIGDSPQPGWDPIFHRDLTKNNVFLGSKDETYFQAYPKPKLGDFGRALVLLADDEHITTVRANYIEDGTDPFLAPEEHKTLDDPDEPSNLRGRDVYSSKVNVWAIGNLMWCLMTGAESHGRDWLPESQSVEDLEHPPFGEWLEEEYSEKLRDLVMHCVNYLPENRPDLNRIMTLIRNKNGELKADVALDVKVAPIESRLFREYPLNVRSYERYPLYASLVAEAAADISWSFDKAAKYKPPRKASDDHRGPEDDAELGRKEPASIRLPKSEDDESGEDDSGDEGRPPKKKAKIATGGTGSEEDAQPSDEDAVQGGELGSEGGNEYDELYD